MARRDISPRCFSYVVMEIAGVLRRRAGTIAGMNG